MLIITTIKLLIQTHRAISHHRNKNKALRNSLRRQSQNPIGIHLLSMTTRSTLMGPLLLLVLYATHVTCSHLQSRLQSLRSHPSSKMHRLLRFTVKAMKYLRKEMYRTPKVTNVTLQNSSHEPVGVAAQVFARSVRYLWKLFTCCYILQSQPQCQAKAVVSLRSIVIFPTVGLVIIFRNGEGNCVVSRIKKSTIWRLGKSSFIIQMGMIWASGLQSYPYLPIVGSKDFVSLYNFCSPSTNRIQCKQLVSSLLKIKFKNNLLSSSYPKLGKEKERMISLALAQLEKQYRWIFTK